MEREGEGGEERGGERARERDREGEIEDGRGGEREREREITSSHTYTQTNKQTS